MKISNKNIGFFYIVAIAILLCGSFFRTIPVSADVIFEPYDNSFYDEHSSDCVYRPCQCISHGPDGKVTLYKSPDNPVATGEIENGMFCDTEWFYTDISGIEWLYYIPDNCWAPVAHFLIVYDSNSFREEFAPSITYVSEEVDFSAYADQEILIYEYPGATEDNSLLVENDDIFKISFNAYFTDEEGHLWGCLAYYYGISNVWICIDSPLATFEELYPNGAPIRAENSSAVIPVNVRESDDANYYLGDVENAPEPTRLDLPAFDGAEDSGSSGKFGVSPLLIVIICSAVALVGIVIITITISNKNKKT